MQSDTEGRKSMSNNYFYELQFVYTDGGTGNTIMSEFYDNRTAGGYESQFAKLAVYMEWKHAIKTTKKINTHYMYELLEFLIGEGFKDATIKTYITAFRLQYNRNKHLFSDDIELPSNAGFEQWLASRKQM